MNDATYDQQVSQILDAWRWCEEHGSFPYRATDGMWQCRGLVVGPARATAIEAVEAARWILATP